MILKFSRNNALRSSTRARSEVVYDQVTLHISIFLLAPRLLNEILVAESFCISQIYYKIWRNMNDNLELFFPVLTLERVRH